MIPQDFHFAFFGGGYFFGVLFLFLILYWGLYRYRRRGLSQFVTKHLIIDRPKSLFIFKVVGFSLVWIMGVLALMQPLANGHYPKDKRDRMAQRKVHDVVLLIDASASMGVKDREKDGRSGMSRLAFAKDIADELMNHLEGESVSLYAFTSGTTQLSPQTLDYLFVRLMLKEIKINEGDMVGTDFVEALANVRGGVRRKTLVVFSDGGDTEVEGLSGEARERKIDQIAGLVSHQAQNQLRVITVGMGSKEGGVIPGFDVNSSLDEGLMKKISEAGQGKYYVANDWGASDLGEELARQLKKRGAPLEDYRTFTGGAEDVIYDLYFQYPLGAAIFFLGVLLCFPETWKRKKL